MDKTKKDKLFKELDAINLVKYIMAFFMIMCVAFILILSKLWDLPFDSRYHNLYYMFFIGAGLLFSLMHVEANNKIKKLKEEKNRLINKRRKYFCENIFREYLKGNIINANKIYSFCLRNDLIGDTALRGYFAGLFSSHDEELIKKAMTLLDNIDNIDVHDQTSK